MIGALEWYRTTGLTLTKGVLSHLSYEGELELRARI
jgi:hypothetical protein